jgi:beta-glucosidase
MLVPGILALLATSVLASVALAQTAPPGSSQPAYQDSSKTPAERATDLVSRMTLGEKAAQLINDAPAIPRLGVREYNWWNEGLHGVVGAGHTTVFPQAIGLAATFDEDHVRRVADTISIEFRAKYLAGLHRFGGSDWFRGLTVWSPNINIFRDPRWGRGQETYGEDPFLTSRMGVAFVQGLQGSGSPYYRTIATPKHYAVHSGPEPTRHVDNFDPSPYDLEDTYLPAFRATVVEGGAGSIMCAYNAVYGVPACASELLLDEQLRQRWGFEGYVVSDCGAVADIYRDDHHDYSDTPEEGVAVALEAGMDLICGDAVETDHILSAIETGILDESIIDRALVRLFTARFALGMFDDPSKVFPGITAAHADTSEHRELARRSAEKAIVLLRNDGLLPLAEAPSRIAVIGPNADSLNSLLGNYHGEPSRPVTVLAGLKKRFPEAEITYAEGAGLVAPALAAIEPETLCQDRSCRSPGLVREEYGDLAMTGEPVAVEVSRTAGFAWEDERKSGAVRYTGYLRVPETGAYTFRYDAHGGYRIRIDDEEVVDAWRVDWRPSIATGTIRLEAGETYPVRIEAFQRQDHGDERLLWATPADKGLAEAVQLAEGADVVVFAAGLTQSVEGEEMRVAVEGFDGGDRTSIDLPAPQRRVLEAVTNTGTPVVLVLINGSALAVNWADEHVSAILEAWYPGGQGGDAVAGVIAGDVNPAGRLPFTVYRSVGDLPPFDDYSMANRTYRYFSGEVLYPFGYGLSYADFEYSQAQVSRSRVIAGEAVDLTVTVTNVGDRSGDEVVQVYISHPQRENAPLRSLVGFERITLAPGESRKVGFTLDPSAMSTVDENGGRVVRAGSANVWIGGGQPDRRPGLPAAAGVSVAFDVTGTIALP